MLALFALITDSFNTRYFHSEGRDAEGACLSMVLGPAFMQYAISGDSFSKVTELAHLESRENANLLGDSAQLSFLLQNHSLAGRSFSKVNIALLHPEFVLMPLAFAGKADAREALAFTGHQEKQTATALHQVGDMEFCTRHDHEMLQLLEKNFSNASVRHAGAAAISLFTDHPALQQCAVFLNVHAGFAELMLRRNGAVQFYNVFAISTPEDVLYYLLFMAEQFSIDPLQLNLGVGGIVPHNAELAACLKRYTAKVTFISNHPSVQVTGRLMEVPSHYYFTLLNQHLCEL